MHSIAHIRQSDMAIQTVEEHLAGVQTLAETIGAKIGAKHIAGLAGMLHDMGKYSDKFRAYILEAVHNPEAPPRRGSVDHSTAGGMYLCRLVQSVPRNRHAYMLAEIAGNAIISHHAYLHDYISMELESPYLNRIQDRANRIDDYETIVERFNACVKSEVEMREYIGKAAAELERYLATPSVESDESKLMFLTKFIFSALIDADRTDTCDFEENRAIEVPCDNRERFFEYHARLIGRMEKFQCSPESGSAVNQLRNELSEQCENYAGKPSGIYTLSIPTGGGKTLSSLRYALKHAIAYNKERIIYIVPFTTIIEQNANEVRSILMDDVNLLEYHSNVLDDWDEEDEWDDGWMSKRQKLKHAQDNWDSPVIYTTMVQFLDVFYAHGSRSIRRLHNLTRSVIVFDEVQKVPLHCISLFNRALHFLRDFGHSSLILCTATQPALDYVEQRLDIREQAEIVSDVGRMQEGFRRVEIVDRAREAFTNDELATFVRDRMEESRSVLVVLNTKAVVKKLFLAMKDTEAHVYHLSTSMCAVHRNDILTKVRGHLNRREQVVCISTQLIEAGVDVSFGCVIRSLAGLDSVAQAAGRCNRHGENGIQSVYVIEHAEESLSKLPEIDRGKQIVRQLLIDLRRDPTSHGGSLLSQGAMKRYFREYYDSFRILLNYPIPQLKKNMTGLLFGGKSEESYYAAYCHNKNESPTLFNVSSIRTAAEHFQVINNQTTAVLVPYDEEGKRIIAQFNGEASITELSRLMRQAQRYTVSLFRFEIDQLRASGGLVNLANGKMLALAESAYSEEFGVDTANESEMGAYIL